MNRRQVLRQILARPAATIVPGCHDALGAALIEQAGFAAAYLSGFCVAASRRRPDLGLITATEMVERAAGIARQVDLPLVVDADAGYGGLANVAETVAGLEAADVAGLHIEDQATPKRCAAMSGKELVAVEEMEARLRAARTARRDPDLTIIARTDAVAVTDLDDAIRRARRYRAAGADAVMVMSLAALDEIVEVVQTVDAPVIVSMAETVRPTIARPHLREAGVAMVVYPLTLLLAAVAAQRAALHTLCAAEDTAALAGNFASFAEINDLVGLAETLRLAGATSTP